MKRVAVTLFFLFLTACVFAQTPASALTSTTTTTTTTGRWIVTGDYYGTPRLYDVKLEKCCSSLDPR